MSCAASFVKIIMFIFNFIISLAGLALVGIGTLIYVKMSSYDKVVEPIFHIAPTLALVIGIIVFIIAFFGCCGTIRESHCMLVTYAVLLLTLFALQLGLGIYAYFQVKNSGGDIEPVVSKSMDKVFNQYNKNQEITELFNVMQQEIHCCGVSGPQDYLKFLDLSVPASCCKHYDGKPCLIATLGATYYTDGCANTLSSIITKGIESITYAVFGISAIEIIGAVLALCLTSSIRNESRRRYS